MKPRVICVLGTTRSEILTSFYLYDLMWDTDGTTNVTCRMYVYDSRIQNRSSRQLDNDARVGGRVVLLKTKQQRALLVSSRGMPQERRNMKRSAARLPYDVVTLMTTSEQPLDLILHAVGLHLSGQEVYSRLHW